MYPKTIAAIKAKLYKVLPDLVANDNGNYPPETFQESLGGWFEESREMRYRRQMSKKREIAAYLLWMCNTMEAETDRGEQSLWLGWVLAVAERELGLLNNDESRALVRSDK